MNRHIEFDELQDYREGLLPREEGQEVEAHLASCPACRAELATLAELMDGLAELPGEAQPARDLWPQIEWRINGSVAEGEAPPPRRRVTVQLWQLMAASIAVALISGGAVWTFLAGNPRTTAPTPSGQPTLAQTATPSGQSTLAQTAALEEGYAEYDTALLELEAILEEGRGILDDETVQLLEENLAIIDHAIAESREALSQDPGSGTLRRILSDTMRRKVHLLQQAAAAVFANT